MHVFSFRHVGEDRGDGGGGDGGGGEGEGGAGGGVGGGGDGDGGDCDGTGGLSDGGEGLGGADSGVSRRTSSNAPPFTRKDTGKKSPVGLKQRVSFPHVFP